MEHKAGGRSRCPLVYREKLVTMRPKMRRFAIENGKAVISSNGGGELEG